MREGKGRYWWRPSLYTDSLYRVSGFLCSVAVAWLDLAEDGNRVQLLLVPCFLKIKKKNFYLFFILFIF